MIKVYCEFEHKGKVTEWTDTRKFGGIIKAMLKKLGYDNHELLVGGKLLQDNTNK